MGEGVQAIFDLVDQVIVRLCLWLVNHGFRILILLACMVMVYIIPWLVVCRNLYPPQETKGPPQTVTGVSICTDSEDSRLDST